MMTGGLRDIETTITKYLVAVHYFLLTLAGIRRLLIILLVEKKSGGCLFLGPLKRFYDNRPSDSLLIEFGARWTVNSAVFLATLRRRRRHAGGVKVPYISSIFRVYFEYISNIFRDSEFNVGFCNPQS